LLRKGAAQHGVVVDQENALGRGHGVRGIRVEGLQV
jgi:hypothetical protein